MSVVQLERINIKPGKNIAPVLNLHQSFLFPRFSGKILENYTQTSNSNLYLSESSEGHSASSSESEHVAAEGFRSIKVSRPETPTYKYRRSRPASRSRTTQIQVPLRVQESFHLDHIAESNGPSIKRQRTGLDEIVEGLQDSFWYYFFIR